MTAEHESDRVPSPAHYPQPPSMPRLFADAEDFERVMAEGPAPQKKHLLHRLVKKVLVHDRRTVEVWYGLPNPQRFEEWNKWLLE